MSTGQGYCQGRRFSKSSVSKKLQNVYSSLDFFTFVSVFGGEDATSSIRSGRNVETNQDCRKTIEQEKPD